MEPAVGSSAAASWRPFSVAAPAAGVALLVAAVLMIGPWPGPDRVWIVTDVGPCWPISSPSRPWAIA